MEIISVKTFVDRKIYRRVPSVKETIHRNLEKQLLDLGASKETIYFDAIDVDEKRCCLQTEVIAYGTILENKET